MSQPSLSRRRAYLQILLLLLFAIGLYGLLPQLQSFKGSVRAITHASRPLMAAALLACLATYAAAAMVYRSLAFTAVPFGRTLVMQFAAMFVNRLLPAGSGALGTNATYLRHQKHSLAQAGVVVGLNNGLGMVGHLLLLQLAFVVALTQAYTTTASTKTFVWIAFGLLAIIVMIGLLLFVMPTKTKHFLAELRKALLSYRLRPTALLGALFYSLCLTICNVLCLWLSLRALGQSVTLTTALFALTAGVSTGAVLPTPGGLGGFEAGMYGYLLTQHLAAPQALTGVLLFRLISFWLPLMLGVVAFGYSYQRGWFTRVRS